MRRPFFSCLVFVFALSVGAETELPTPPEGFRWERAEEVKGAYLVPDGWYFKSSKRGGTLGYYASRENIDTEGVFLVGMTVNVKRNLEGKSVKTAVQELVRGYARSGTILKFSDASQDPFIGSVLQLDDGITTMHILLVGNPETNTLYIFLFEAPTREWPKMWNDFGKVMFKQLLIDDGI